jgi:Rieske 2Fe-2S family protein
MAKTVPSPGEILAQRFFIDANVFAEETEKIFRTRWLFLERASVLENVGDFISTDLEGEGLIAVRGRDDAICVFYNVCRHRGTRLCNEAKGNRTRVFTCPYHAWSYGLDGALIGAPHMDETEGFNKADFPLKSLAHAKWEGGVFVNLGDDPEPFEQAYAPVLTKFTPWHLGELRPAHREVCEVAANWKLIVQNYSECYHCPIIHPALEKLSHYRDTENDLEEGPFLGGPMRIGQEGGGLSRDGQRTAPPLPGVEGENLQRAFYYVLFPTLLLSVQPDFVLMHHLQRVAPNHTRIVCQWLYHPEAIAGKSFDPQPTIDLWDEVNRQDWHVSELTQKGIASRAHTSGPYSSLEGMPAAFDCEYLKAMGRG